MTDHSDKSNYLLLRLELLLKRHDEFSKEINNLRIEIGKLNQNELKQDEIVDATESVASDILIEENSFQMPIRNELEEENLVPNPKLITVKSDIEKFIGENLINKIGILVTIIGVAIGAKYSIDNDLISPLTRIILGYLLGLGLLGFGIKLKRNYEHFSAVLVSGAMAIMYVITYTAFSLYQLFPQVIAFSLMVIFTIFTVLAAINYNRQIIAHIGLVGAYAVPFLLSDGSGKVIVLFSYVALINVGILVISFKKYWKSLYYSAFGLTWLIYFVWYATSYHTHEHFGIACTFLGLYFIIFYLIFLAYKILRREKYDVGDVLLLMANTFIFYGIGTTLLMNHSTGKDLLGVFTLLNAVIHFIVSVIIYRNALADRTLFYLANGLVLVFITISIPVQLDGNWVTLIWAGEAALLFWIGKTKNVTFYVALSHALMLLAFLSICHDWSTVYSGYDREFPETRLMPLLNSNFLTSLLFIAAFGFITYLNQNKKYEWHKEAQNEFSELISICIPVVLIFAIYNAFRLEITCYWDQYFSDSVLKIETEDRLFPKTYRNFDLRQFKTIWVINYSLLFITVLSFLNTFKIKNKLLGHLNLGFVGIGVIMFLTLGLATLSELRDSFITQSPSDYYHVGKFHIVVRYVSFVFVISVFVACYKYIKQEFIPAIIKMVFDLFLHLTILWIACSELMHWLDMFGFAHSNKLGISVLWGLYSLFLIILGIWKKKKFLRIAAIILFGVTLIKLFIYDISHLNTISKTVVFVSLGVLLLVISFLYTKYKNLITDDVEN